MQISKLGVVIFLAASLVTPHAHAFVESCKRHPDIVTALEKTLQKPCRQITKSDIVNVQDIQVDRPNSVDGPALKATDFADFTRLARIELGGEGPLPADLFKFTPHLIVVKIQTTPDLPSTIFQSLHELEDLKIQGSSAKSFPENFFIGLDSLLTLQISNTDVESLPANLLKPLHKLGAVDITDNRSLTTLPEDFFAGVPLFNITLNGNNFATLPTRIFTGQFRLSYLDLHGNHLKTLDRSIFKDLTSLYTLWLNGNELTLLPSELFLSLNNVKNFSITGNDLKQLPANAFTGLNSLRKLDLSFTRLESIAPNAFAGLPNIEELIISEHFISQISTDSFNGLPNLTSLDFSGPNYSIGPVVPLVLTPHLFARLPALQLLNLSLNHIASIPTPLFCDLPALRGLDLGVNQLTTLTDANLADLKDLSQLSIGSNYIHQNDITRIRTALPGTTVFYKPQLVKESPVGFRASNANGD